MVSLSRDSKRHPLRGAQHDQSTSQRIIVPAHEQRPFGYRRIGDLLRAKGATINDKRVTGKKSLKAHGGRAYK